MLWGGSQVQARPSTNKVSVELRLIGVARGVRLKKLTDNCISRPCSIRPRVIHNSSTVPRGTCFLTHLLSVFPMVTDMSTPGLYDRDQAFWENYLKTRPNIPESFFRRIFDYHASHGGEFGTVHDAGAGAGVCSSRLATRFHKVIVTDISEGNIRIAKERLSADNQQYDFRVSKLEDTIELPKASVDLVHAGTMFHFTDVDKAFEAVAHQVKPNGTVAIAFVGLVFLMDPKIDAAWRECYYASFRGIIENEGFEEMRWSYQCSASAGDAIPLPDAYFKPGAKRIRLNIPDSMSWHEHALPPECRDEISYISSISDADVVENVADKAWKFQTTLHGLREHMATFPFDLSEDQYAPLWSKLEEAIGNEPVEAVWPATLILVTRK